MKIFKIMREFKKSLSPYRPSIVVRISKNNLLHNLREFSGKYPHLSFAPVLKSNAYGHGLVEVAEILDKEKIAFFVLDSLYEAIVLRNRNIRSKILIIGYTQPENIRHARLHEVAFTITSIEQLRELAGFAGKPVRIHLKIDTGMHRQGLLPSQLDEAVSIIKANSKIVIEGICSHFADADGPDDAFTRRQIDVWTSVSQRLQMNFSSIKHIHISASAGTFYSSFTPGNVARLGLSLYGIKANPKSDLRLKPAMQIESLISSVKEIGPNEGIGYNLTYQTPATSRIATVPMGYYEGIDRRLSNLGFYKVAGVECPIVGRVSMNITSVDVTAVPQVKLGDRVVVLSADPTAANSVENIAKQIKTIPYEILVHIPQSLRREVVDEI